jgi:lipoyl(octanoyl) transferase
MQKVIYEQIEGRSYQDVWDYQNSVHKALINKKIAQKDAGLDIKKTVQEHRIILCEHAPVYTLGRSGDAEHLLLSEAELEARGIEYFPINRGGDITYHGPGQITGYPILDLDCFYTDVHKYVRMLEEAVICTLAEYGIVSERMQEYTGVWILDARGKRKICAIGVHLSRWVTLHGFALNVNTDLTYFDHIVPCGIAEADKTVTSMQAELGKALDMEVVRQKYLNHFAALFQCTLLTAQQNFK